MILVIYNSLMPVPVACLSPHFLYNYHGIHQKTASDDFCCVHDVAEGFTWRNLHGQLDRTRKDKTKQKNHFSLSYQLAIKENTTVSLNLISV